jgi:type I restriction enzyme S subunit
MKHELEKYDVYNDSGIEWIGEVPSHWELKRLKEISEINKRTLSENTSSNYEFNYVDIGSVTYGVKGFATERMTFDIAPSRAKRVVKKGDTIISTVRTYLKAIASIDDDVSDLIVSTGFAVISPNKRLFNKYYSYLLTSDFIVNEICALSKGVSYPATNSSVIGDLFCLVPTYATQQSIADYLDTKTAQIDRKIDLLTQKAIQYGKLKQSLINETVTRGLDKTVAMKDSGVEWIGEVPEHWEVKRFKELFPKSQTGWTPDTKNQSNFDGNNIWVTIRDMNLKHVHNSEIKLSDSAVKTYNMPVTPKGSLLFSFKLSIGKISFAGCDLFTNEAIISILPQLGVNLNYYFYSLPIYLVLNAKENIYGAKLLNQGLIFNTNLIFPSRIEQKAIADYLDIKTAHIDNIIETINTQIEKLKELRKTLINDVVTGKIKVSQ